MSKKKVKYRYRFIPKERRNKTMNAKSRKLISGLLVVFIVIISLVMYSRSDHFNIKTINVEGLYNLKRSEVTSVTKIKKGINIFDYNKNKEIGKISELSMVESVDIIRDLPDTVYIYIKERANTLCILLNNEYYYLDKDFLIIKKEPTITDTDVILANISLEIENVNFSEGALFDCSADYRLGIIKNVYDYAQKNELTQYISEIYISPKGINYLYTTKSNVLKFYNFTAFEENKDFIKNFIVYEDRHIMAEVVEDSRPVYKVIEIQ